MNHAQAASGAQQQATAVVESAGQIARDAYQALAKVARATLKDKPAQLVALKLDGAMPRTTAGFLSNAMTMFDNAQGIPEIPTALAEYGYTADKLQTERAKIVNYDQANQAQEAAKGAAQQATERSLCATTANCWKRSASSLGRARPPRNAPRPPKRWRLARLKQKPRSPNC